MNNHKRFCGMMNALGEVFDKQMSKIFLEVYWTALKPFGDQEVEVAFSKAMVSCTFFPKPVELIELISGSSSDRLINAWEKVLKAMSDHGAYQSVRFNDPTIHSTLQLMGGWVECCKWTIDELKWKQKEFEKIYATMAKRTDHPDHLDGLLTIDNAARGYLDYVPKPIEIGSPQEPKQIEDKPKKLRMLKTA